MAKPREARGPDGSRPSCGRLAVRRGRRTREGLLRPTPASRAEPKAELTPESRTPRNAADRAGRRHDLSACLVDWGVDWGVDWVDSCPIRDSVRRAGDARARDDSSAHSHFDDDRPQRNRGCGDAPPQNGRNNRDDRAATTRRYWRTNSSPTRSKPGFSEKRALKRPRPANFQRLVQSYELTHLPVGMQSLFCVRPAASTSSAIADPTVQSANERRQPNCPNRRPSLLSETTALPSGTTGDVVIAMPALCDPSRTIRPRAGSGCIVPAGGGRARRFP